MLFDLYYSKIDRIIIFFQCKHSQQFASAITGRETACVFIDTACTIIY